MMTNNDFIIEEGIIYTWGSGAYGKLGHGAEKSSLVPKPILGYEHVLFSQISSVYTHCAALSGMQKKKLENQTLLNKEIRNAWASNCCIATKRLLEAPCKQRHFECSNHNQQKNVVFALADLARAVPQAARKKKI